MMERRSPKKTDKQQTEKAFQLIKECMANHPEIEPTLWAGAVWSILVHGYSASGVSYEQFTKEWDKLKHHYKSWFDK
jgi:hypothetical protein